MNSCTPLTDPFGIRDTIQTAQGPVGIYRLDGLERQGIGRDCLPCPTRSASCWKPSPATAMATSSAREDVQNLARWNAAPPADVEIPFQPARVVLQDFTGVPAVVDLAAMRSCHAAAGRRSRNASIR